MFSLPHHDLLKQQAGWLAEARSRLLRLAEIGRRRMVLDLGCGSGATLEELEQRCSGTVVALDSKFDPLGKLQNAVNADALHIPFPDASFDLVFSQNFFLWIRDCPTVIAEILRILQPAGAFVNMEPDYGGLIESPSEIESKSLWINGLLRAGADPFIGRKMTGYLNTEVWNVRVDLLPRLYPPHIDRFRFLEDLPLTVDEQLALAKIRENCSRIPVRQQLVHLPYFLIFAEKSSEP